MPIKVTTEAEQALRNLRVQMLELHKKLLLNSKSLVETYRDNQTGLGSHSADIGRLIEDIAGDDTTEQPVKVLTRKLKDSANIIRFHLDNNNFGTSKTR